MVNMVSPNRRDYMKGTEHFKTAIQSYLDKISEKDPLFKKTMEKENKNIDDCITYILNTVQKTGANGFAEAEIYGMALHYYDEDKLDIGKEIQAQVIINRHVELTDEEISELKQKAREDVVNAERKRMTEKNSPKKTSDAYLKDKKEEKADESQPTLF